MIVPRETSSPLRSQVKSDPSSWSRPATARTPNVPAAHIMAALSILSLICFVYKFCAGCMVLFWPSLTPHILALLRLGLRRQWILSQIKNPPFLSKTNETV